MSTWPQITCEGRKIGYARVSTRDQKLRMQRDGLNAVGCDMIFEDHGVSGAKKSRDGLDKMLKELKPGDAVVVFKLDRLGRSVLQLADLLVRFNQQNIHFCSICEGINTTTPGGKFVFHIFAAVAEFHREIIIENTLEGIAAARRRGKKLGRPYVLQPSQILEIHRHMAQQGLSISELAEKFCLSRATLSRGLKRVNIDKA